MRTPVTGVTTPGSEHPRVEFRELTNSGTEFAAWDSSDGIVHTMNVTQTVTHVPALA